MVNGTVYHQLSLAALYKIEFIILRGVVPLRPVDPAMGQVRVQNRYRAVIQELLQVLQAAASLIFDKCALILPIPLYRKRGKMGRKKLPKEGFS